MKIKNDLEFIGMPDVKEHYLRALEAEDVPVGIVILESKKYNITFVNPVLSRSWGRTKEQVINKPLFEAIPELESQVFKDLLDGVYTTGIPYLGTEVPAEYNLDGRKEIVYYNFVYSALRNEEGNVYGIFVTAIDVTQQVNAKKDLTNEQERFHTLIEKSTDAIQLVSPEGEILYTSQSIKNVLGYTPEELKGAGIAPFMHPDDLEYFMKNFQELLQEQGKQIVLEYRVKHKDGSWAWLETVGVNHLHTPHIRALVGNFRNITDRKLAEEKLKENEARLHLALEAGDIGVWDWDVESNKIHWTDKVYEIHEIEKDAFHGSFEHYTQRIHADDQEKVRDAIRMALANEAPYDIEFRIITAKGNLKWISTSAKVMFQNNKPVRMLGATVDITQRKLLEGQKDEFLRIASHELKTPVTSIKAYGQVLQNLFEKEGNEKAVTYMQRMDKQVNNLTALIGDLLDVTKIQSGRLAIHEEEYDINALVNEIIGDMQLTTMRHTLIKNQEGSIKVYGDKERTGQVITNFISNAIKYSPQGGEIIISITANKNDITFCVQDHGIGISAENINKVFEQFFRVSGDDQHTFPGLGLGLYICGEIIKRQGGRIWAESTKAKGSSFYFSLPVRKNE